MKPVLIVAALFGMNSICLAGPGGTFYGVGPGQITAIEGNAVVNTWNTQNYGEYLIAVSNGSIRTASPLGGQANGQGAQYALNGVPTGITYMNSIQGLPLDGTSDGVHNYTVEYFSGTVYRTNLDWSNPTALFSTGRQNLDIGITFDRSNQSLWVMGYNDNSMRNYSLSGNLLSSFGLQNSNNSALALDASDNTLWMATQGELGRLTQYSKNGVFLGNYNIVGANNFWWGGEIAVPAVPEPGSWALMMVGLGLLGLRVKRRRTIDAL